MNDQIDDMDFDEKKHKELINEQSFYINLTVYAFVLFVCILIWLFMGCGPFWPIWVACGFGISLFLEASKADWIPFLKEYFPFLYKK